MLFSAQLAPMVDDGLFQLVGVAPSGGNNNEYEMDVNVFVFGPPDHAHARAVKARLQRAGVEIGGWSESPVSILGFRLPVHILMQGLSDSSIY